MIEPKTLDEFFKLKSLEESLESWASISKLHEVINLVQAGIISLPDARSLLGLPGLK